LRGKQKESPKSKLFHYSRCEFGPHRQLTQGASLRKYIGEANSLRSSFFQAFWLFRLSVVPASCHSGFLVVRAILSLVHSLQTKEIKKGKRTIHSPSITYGKSNRYITMYLPDPLYLQGKNLRQIDNKNEDLEIKQIPFDVYE
jgi:hypothetical protein